MNKEEKDAYEKTKRWLEEHDSFGEMKKVLEKAAETIEKLNKAREVSKETLDRRIDI